ncbi:MAG: hypothetical protein PUB18_02040 [bacterium]|nr:hypothetical protein [bacterium]
MENRINKILNLKNGHKYLVLNQAYYKGNNFYFAVKITDDEEDVTDEFRLLEEKQVDGKIIISTVEDPKMIKLLAEYLSPKE